MVTKEIRPADRHGDESGVSTIAAILALALIVAVIAICATTLHFGLNLASNVQSHQAEQVNIATLNADLRQDASTAQAIFLPTNAVSGSACNATGPCDEIRFYAQRADQSPSYISYYSNPTTDMVYRCPVASALAGAACTSPAQVVLLNASYFRVSALTASQVATALNPRLSNPNIPDYQKPLLATTAGPRVLASNRTFIVQYATANLASEVSLLGNAQTQSVSVQGSTIFTPVGGRSVSTQPNAGGNTFSFIPGSPTTLGGNTVAARYNGSFNIGNPATTPVASFAPSTSTYACKSTSTGVTIANVVYAGYSYSPWPSSLAKESYSVNAVGYGNCQFAKSIPNANILPGDAAQSNLVYVTNYGTVNVNGSPAAYNAWVWQTESLTVPITVTQAGWTSGFAIASNSCAGGKATVTLNSASGAVTVVGGNNVTNCTVTISGAPGVAAAIINIQVRAITYTVNSSSGIHSASWLSGTIVSPAVFTNTGSDGNPYPVETVVTGGNCSWGVPGVYASNTWYTSPASFGASVPYTPYTTNGNTQCTSYIVGRDILGNTLPASGTDYWPFTLSVVGHSVSVSHPASVGLTAGTPSAWVPFTATWLTTGPQTSGAPWTATLTASSPCSISPNPIGATGSGPAVTFNALTTLNTTCYVTISDGMGGTGNTSTNTFPDPVHCPTGPGWSGVWEPNCSYTPPIVACPVVGGVQEVRDAKNYCQIPWANILAACNDAGTHSTYQAAWKIYVITSGPRSGTGVLYGANGTTGELGPYNSIVANYGRNPAWPGYYYTLPLTSQIYALSYAFYQNNFVIGTYAVKINESQPEWNTGVEACVVKNGLGWDAGQY